MTNFPGADGNQQFHLFSPVQSIEDQPKEQKAKRATSRRNLRVVERAETAPLFDLLITSESQQPCLAVASTDAHAEPQSLITIPFTTENAKAEGAESIEQAEPRAADQPAKVLEFPQADESPRPPNYVISDIHTLMSGGAKAKFRRNVEAIRLMRQLTAESREPSEEERHVLAGFVGWGQFPQVFADSDDNGKWAAEREEVRALLDEAEYRAAEQTTINAHYTNPEVVLAMWRMVERLGFRQGRIQEPGCGVGLFIGCAPANIAHASRFTGVEVDPITSRLASLLYPQANIINKPYQQVPHLTNFFDLVVGNVPFGDFAVLTDQKYRQLRPYLHDYFLLRAVDETRPGGLVLLLTSTGTMDKKNSRIRTEIESRADLVAAMRFPERTHKALAGTDVVTDLLILRKRLDGEASGSPAWMEVVEVPDPDGGDPIPVNEYFADSPYMILGRLDRTGSMYSGNSVNVSRTADFEAMLAQAIELLPENICVNVAQPTAEICAVAPDDAKENGFVLREGSLFVKQGRVLTPYECDRDTFTIIVDTLEVRDCVRRLFNGQLAGAEAEVVSEARRALNLAYDRFLLRHGPLNLTKNKKAFSPDPDAPLVRALENYSTKNKKARKADIFYRDTIRSFVRAGRASSVGEALAIVLNEKGRIDLDRMAQLLESEPQAIGRQMVSQALAFNDPVNGWTPASIYLSGNVKQKLAQAREAAAIDAQYRPNIEALERVIPDDIDAVDIDARLGAPWLPPSVIVEFMCELLGAEPEHFEVHFLPNQGQWVVGYTPSGERLHESKAAATTIYGTRRVNFIEVMQAALDNKSIVVYDEDQSGTRKTNHEESASATAKVREVRNLFSDWLWENDSRRERLHRLYNDTFNTNVLPRFVGAHLTLPGMRTEFQMRDYQKNYVWRIICTGRALVAAKAGSGKTAIYLAAAMELKRLGLARKPMLVVLKSTIDQITKMARYLYPHARILSTAGRFDAQSRNHFISQIATGSPDVVILTHDQLDMLPMTPETRQRFLQKEIEELEYVMELAEAEGGKRSSRIVKRLAKAKERLQERILEAIEGGRKDNTVYFEELGVDFLFCDESHFYKAIPIHTRQDRIKGIPTSRSDRATNMLMRTRWLFEQNNWRGVVFGSGTAISNSLAELFVNQQYLQRDELEARNIHSFDSWCSVFAEIQSRLELTVVGDYQPVARLAAYVNIPELLALAHQVMEVKLLENLPDLRLPRREDFVLTAEINAEQKAYLKALQKRASLVKMSKPVKGGDNMLSITTDARKMSADARLAISGAGDDEGSKLNILVRNVLSIYRETTDPRVQLIFSDLGIYENGWGFSVYRDIKIKLVDAGIPADKIIDFSAVSDRGRDRATERLRSGDAVIAIGSTQRMGTGLNVQDRVTAIHHFSVPWLPSDLEQCDARGVRHGNLHYDWGLPVRVFRYVTVGSFDAFSWQIVDNKLRFIRQIMVEGTTTQRKFKEVDTEELSASQVMAIASGDPRLLEKVQLEEEVAELRAAKRRHDRAQMRLKDEAAHARRSIDNITAYIAALESDSRHVESLVSSEFAMVVEGAARDNRKQAAIDLTLACSRDSFVSGERVVGSFKGFSIVHRGYDLILKREGEYSFNVKPMNPAGTVSSIEGVLRNIGGRIQQAKENLQAYETNLAKTEGVVDRPFRQAAELDLALEKLEEVGRQLKEDADASDLEAAA